MDDGGKDHGHGVIAVHGHERAVAALTGALASGHAPQACLLVGPPSVGRSTVARHVAQWLLCAASGPDRPCGQCRGCRLVAADGHPDVCLLEAPLKVDAVRELQRRLALAPVEADWHVAVLPDIDRASAGAANSLLKTLEEPPSGTLLLLTAADAAAVLPTVRSRCQTLSLRPLSRAAASAALQDAGLDRARAQTLARLSGGRLGWAIAAARDPSLLEGREMWLERLETALEADGATRLNLADAWARQKEALAEGFGIWLGWWRDVLLLQHDLQDAVVNVDRIEGLRRTAERVPVEATARLLRTLQASAGRLAGGGSSDLAACLFLLDLPS
jgi:DNA polymerase-3 subunit delta'